MYVLWIIETGNLRNTAGKDRLNHSSVFKSGSQFSNYSLINSSLGLEHRMIFNVRVDVLMYM